MVMANDEQREREERQTETHREELVERLARTAREDGTVEPLRGLHIHRVSTSTEPVHGVSIPSFCVIAQGSKTIYLGDDYYRYDPAHYLLATVELPIVIQIGDASKERPYFSLRLDLDPVLVGSVMVEAGLPSPRGQASAKAIDVSPLDVGLLDATVRLVRLVESPAEARILMPLVTREIVYRLLVGAQSNRLRHLAAFGGATNRIATALERIRGDFDKPLRIESLARELGMSPSGFHAQFKAVTAMSPLQFQKQLRLQEARRLMFGEDLDATTAGRRVGYDDASYFNREYKSLFGVPPMRDVQQLRATATASADL
ncbi:MAG: AraC family transcriptional regulator [Chloroflexi bacterium]|nr:AraC family transcriptional regulator [Chloroflexota bacterium]